jgi:hypothetical protein
VLRAIQGAEHRIDLLFDGVDHRARGVRSVMAAREFAGQIAGEVADAFQARGQRDG